MKTTKYTILDLETTGLSKFRHKITEIAAVKIKNNKIIDKFETLVNPETHIPKFITKLTGIDNELVKDKDPIEKVLPKLDKFIDKTTIVAHNAGFDYGFLNHNSEECLNKHLTNDRLCTRKLANRILPELHSKKLSALCEHFGLVNDQAHRAMADTLVTKDVFGKFSQILNESNITSHSELLKFENMPVKKAYDLIKK